MEVVADFPDKLGFLFESHRYKVAHGGRGGAKSWGFARALLIKAAERRMRVLCARELQLSIADSVHKLLKEQIEALSLGSFYTVNDSVIRGRNGSEFIFSGLRSNATKIKSMEGLDIAWVEEAQTVSAASWEILIPTVRKEGSEIWVSFNPDQEDDPTYQRFVVEPPPGARVVEIGWQDNPWLPQVLIEEKDYLYRVDPEAAEHVWGGKTLRNSVAQVLRGRYVVESFEPGKDWGGPYFGADWGFAVDPTTLIRCWVDKRTLYIEHEAYGIGIDIDDTPALFERIPGSKDHTIRADNSRPETISHMRRHGYPRMMGCVKGKGSVEDGVEHLRSYERIVIHPRCPHAAEEARLWSYKTDKLTGDVLPVLLEKHDHCLIGGTMVETIDGPRAIASLVGTEGLLHGEDGSVTRFHSVRMTAASEAVHRITLADGREITATGEHMFITERGWTPLLALRPGARIVDASDAMRYAKQTWDQRDSNATGSGSCATTAQGTTGTLPCGSECTGTCGGCTTGGYPGARTCTTATGTEATTTSATSSYSAPARTIASTGAGTVSAARLWFARTSRRLAWLLRHGIGRMRAASGTGSTEGLSPRPSGPSLQRASNAALGTAASSRDAFARMLASLLGAGGPGLIQFAGNALCVALPSQRTSTPRPEPARLRAGQRWVTVVSVEPAGRAAVYNLEADGPHTFLVAGGVVTHNCWDAVRYALEPIIRAGKPGRKPPPPKPKKRDYDERAESGSYKTV